jgi:hypothetical protein
MTAPHADPLIDGYLARLRVAATDLPSSVRDELIEDMRAHIAEARAREPEETDATILNILDRLGEPAVVVAEARERLGLRTPGPSRQGIVEIAAVVLLPFFWVIGVILLWWSSAWRVRDKVIGTICSVGGYPFVLVVGINIGHQMLGPMSRARACSSTTDAAGNVQTLCGPTIGDVIINGLLVALLVGIYLLPVLTSVYLVIRLRWRPRRQIATAA